MGATVVALSTSQDKKMEALELGAKEFVNLNELNVKAPLDVSVLTSSKYPDFGEYVLCYLVRLLRGNEC
jgi:D-arabinose 1-dehydrogenase-like Zn-dependent alcohol dehydrogenase